MSYLSYEVVDVFATGRFSGNPLAIVLDAGGLTTGQMAAIGREFNLSETVFVVPACRQADYRVRIFTPAAELPFAGHPSVGAAVTLARLDRIRSGAVIQECGAGLLPLTVDGDKARLTGAVPDVGEEQDPDPLLAAAGLAGGDLVGLPVRTASAGLEHTFLPVTGEAVGRACPDLAAARTHGVKKVYVFAWDAARRHAHARFFGPGVGVPEDPATGSAALALGAWLAAAKLVPVDGTTGYTIAQGIEMGRPSSMECGVTTVAGQAVRTTVAGQVVPVAEGRIRPV